MEFEWDPAKGRDNQAKHNVTFREATEVFADPILHRFGPRSLLGEERFVIFGTTSRGPVPGRGVHGQRGGETPDHSLTGNDPPERQAYEQ